MSVRHVTLLPEPLSPTTPRISPRRNVNETSSTARTTPPSVRMNVCSPVTRRISSVATATAASDIAAQEVREAVADQAEGDADDHDRDARQRRQPPRAQDVVLAVGDHRAQLRGRWLRAEPEKAERGAEQHVP